MAHIIIADGHRLYREALCSYIQIAETDLRIEGVDDYEGLKRSILQNKIDLVLLEENLPGMEEQFIQDEIPFARIGILIATSGPQKERNTDDIQGIFPKSLSSKAMLTGIQDLLKGRTFFPDLGGIEPQHLADGFRRPPEDFNLTPREREVLGFLVKGSSNKEIARMLDLQVVTVKLHVRGICRKLRAANRTQAALIAVENGWGE